MKSLEDMAREKLEMYMNKQVAVVNGKEYVLCPGWPAMIAARKASAANPQFEKEIYKIANAIR